MLSFETEHATELAALNEARSAGDITMIEYLSLRKALRSEWQQSVSPGTNGGNSSQADAA